MDHAPYPGLNPDLWDLVAELARDPNPVPEHLRPTAQLRAAIEEVEALSPPLPEGVKTRDQTFRHGHRDVPYRTYTTATPRPETMLYFHGGGWSMGSLDGHDAVCADIALQTGLRVVSLDFALAPENPYPAALNECVAGVDHLRGAGANSLWLGGDSAGGNLALCTALKLRDLGQDPAAGLLLFYPALDPSCAFPSHKTHADAPYLSHLSMRRCWSDYLGATNPTPYAAPLTADLRGLPQTIIQTAELDPLVDEGASLAQRLTNAGTPVWHDVARGIIHGYVRFRDRSPSSAAAFTCATDALSKALAAP